MTKISRKTLRGPEEIFQELRIIAKKEYKTMNGLIIQVLMDWLKEQRKERSHEAADDAKDGG